MTVALAYQYEDTADPEPHTPVEVPAIPTMVFEGVLAPQLHHGGVAALAEFARIDGGPDKGVFVRLHSWDEHGAHPMMSLLAGRRVRVVVEPID